MVKLLFLGIIAGAFFSSTFLLNELMSLSGGHWVWSASLRYAFMILFLLIILLYQGGAALIAQSIKLFRQHLLFWISAGSIGFGFFYALICFSADYAPGWVVAATWQFTVVATLFVLMLFGKRFPAKIWRYSLMIFIGVCLVNFSQVTDFNLTALLLGGAPVLLAAFCYPVGNQLLWEAQQGSHSRIPQIRSQLLANPFAKVLLLCLGSVPLWLILLLLIQPPMPSPPQLANSALVALFSGVIATTLFLYARNQATNANELAGVDATQASEVIFALLGGLLFLHSAPPTPLAYVGLLLILVGLFLFANSTKHRQ